MPEQPETVPLSDVQGKVDFAVITIREEEFVAVLERFPPRWLTRGEEKYNISTLTSRSGAVLYVATIRTAQPGHSDAQSAAHHLLNDLDPSCLVLVGIGGAKPESEFSLGDVVTATRLHDFSVTAAVPGGRIETAIAGAPTHRVVQTALANLRATESLLGEWNSEQEIRRSRPPIDLENEKNFTGSNSWNEKIKLSVNRRFGSSARQWRPLVTAVSVGSGNILVRDYRLLRRWLEYARDLKAVEMELPGVFAAARSVKGDRPVLAIRGISDIVGFNRHPAWTEYACHSAASFARAFLAAELLDIPPKPKSDGSGNSLRSEAPPSAEPTASQGPKEIQSPVSAVRHPKDQSRFVKDAHPHIRAFISHAREDHAEALQYRDALANAKFDVWKYDAKPNPAHFNAIEKEIRSRQFFILLLSQISPTKSLLQRELGLAAAIQRRNRGYLPLIITVLSRHVEWNHENILTTFPTGDFYTGESCDPVPLKINLAPDSDDFTAHSKELFEYMRPQLIISRIDFFDTDAFHDTEVFTLYEDLFPPVERDNPNDIMDWVLNTDIGENRVVRLDGETEFDYRLDSRYCILTLAKKAIGLAFLTYDYRYSIMYGNYIAVQESWRAYGLADAFVKKIKEAFAEEGLFQDCRGTVLEVERFDKAEIYRKISYLEEQSTETQFRSPNDYDQIRRFLRVCWYEGMGYKFFFSSKLPGAPIACTAPYLDPDSELPVSEWASQEEEYWLMWKSQDRTTDLGNAGTIWRDCVRCVYIEILAKSLVERCSSNSLIYWEYVNGVVKHLLDSRRDAEITVGSYVRKDHQLQRRWHALKIPIAV